MYLTGRGGVRLWKLILEGHMNQTGLITSDMLTLDQVDTYFDYAKDLGITLSTHVEELMDPAQTDPDR